ncbi:MAG: 1-deoxy-D-xylulose-5-phosphate reductoisomerase [Leptospiraceae bacterium]|nr:1-deoxy-D-xylulose-5-phosphate reductoisomerase [Leptospiraceae bacterium]
MMKNISLLGASGSVGTSTLKVIRTFPDKFKLVSFGVNSNIQVAKSIIEEFKPEYATISSPNIDRYFLKDNYQGTPIIYGEEGMVEIVKKSNVDIVVTAVVGAVGIKPTVEAIQNEKKIALANKETMVTFGPYISKLLEKYKKAQIVPVDSEHNALFQLIESHGKENIRSLTLTASGGPFRTMPLEEIQNVGVEDALNHPTWKMGPKITVDSAGMINKALEVIEAHFLFHTPYQDIKVVIHPESIVHGLVELKDGAFILYASHPDMIYPISHSLFYPEVNAKLLIQREPASWKNLTFEEVENKRYPAFQLAYQAGIQGGTAPAIFNAANEEAVSQFLNKKIRFVDIPALINHALQTVPVKSPSNLDEYLEADTMARITVQEKTKKGNI